MSHQSKAEIESLTALRGIAAIGVVIFHYSKQFPALADLTALATRYYLWVDVFFVLSGFIISYVYYPNLVSGVTPVKTRKFILARLARIYPMHFFTLMLLIGMEGALWMMQHAASEHYGVAAFSSEARNIPAIFSNLLLIHSLGIHNDNTWNGPSWSISCEWVMYLLFPLLVVIFRNFGRLLWGGLFFISATGIYLLNQYHPMQTLDITYDFGIIRCAAGFIAGMAIHHFWQGNTFQSRRMIFAASWAILAAIFIVMSTPAIPDYAVVVLGWIMVAGFAFAGTGYADNILMKSIGFVGKISYSIYLMHIPMLLFLKNIMKVLGVGDWLSDLNFINSLLVLLCIILILIGLSFLTYCLVEKQFRLKTK